MDSKPVKIKRRRIRKTKIKPPSSFKLKMANFLGPSYLESSLQFHVGIAILLVLFVALILLMILTAPPPAPGIDAP